MDGVIPLSQADAAMPPPAPLDMPAQDFGALPGQVRALPPAARDLWLWRLAVFGPAILTTGLLLWAFGSWLSAGGLNALETLILVLVGMTFVWISLSVAIASVGLIGLSRKTVTQPSETAEDLSVALLVPIYNEVPWDVFGNAAAMLDDLRAAPNPRRYTLFMLSDTRDEAIAEQEWRAFHALRASHGDVCDIHYRRRPDNTNRKIGNLTNWITHWGAGHDAMLVLDADSLMSGRAIMRLRDALARDPSAGLIQSCPRLIRAETLFGRVQQFANTAYGWVLAEGLALWSQHEGNYWGHNAIIRTQAFAASAGLPPLRGLTGRKHMILSHDFVEAGLLRRAGWAVRFLPDIGGSYEETPASLIDYVIRDRRWCQGNLQHLRLLASRGFHPISRFHLFHGAISYLLSPAWFVLLVFWALLGVSPDTGVIQYFSLANPMYPDWPEMSPISSLMLLLFMYSMLLAPKVMGATAIALSPAHRRAYGGGRSFALSFLVEVAASIAYAPILMIQQTLAVIRSVVGLGVTWSPQKRDASGYGTRTLIRFHLAETIIGWLLLLGISAGLISLWLLPIAISLAFAVPLSMLSTLNLGQIRWSGLRLETPQTLREPAVVSRARHERKRLQILLLDERASQIAAE